MGVLVIQNYIIGFYEFVDNKDGKKQKNFFEIIVLFVSAIAFYLFFKTLILDKIITNKDFLESVSKIFLFLFIAVFICVYVIYNKTLKGVFLYNDHIQIVYAITKRNLLNIKPKIKYSEITKCEKIANSIDNKVKYNIALNYISGNGDEYVMIETIFDKVFFFCVENQDEFVNELLTRVNN